MAVLIDIVVSDLHLGGWFKNPQKDMLPRIQEFFGVMENRLLNGTIGRLHCLGDMWDLWGRRSTRQYLRRMRRRYPKLQGCLERLVHLENCTFYVGNHDQRLKRYLPLKDDNYCPKTRMYLVHGHEYSFFSRHSQIGRLLFGVMHIMRNSFWSGVYEYFHQKHEQIYRTTFHEEKWKPDSENIAAIAFRKMEEHPEYRLFITGDTHYPLIRQKQGEKRYYINSGNLFERGDVIEIHHHPDEPRIHQKTIDDYV